MPERRVVVASKVGLHARPAAVLARTAAEQPAKVTIRKEGGQPVEAASVLGLMTLGAMHGDEVVLAAEGEGAETALDAVAALIATDLDES
ncbi:phosphocarrier protein [Streptoalloteichus tenebrarius]|uniref:Phosphocarrier protein HPr n=1 Tax=Streptoalloteichus tenebrarius (strain ATCC 17920 / DSM 40477 / JCM 4838 / CBS 697.72 / NBRC 16177 / NCIMB 11028 / NRRL B-12390 / A12253. 1 / ISP 5477) TaxID=1933 RepID=A0ABT1HSB8_STRSD|nr:HPr family phosphocarrier protein [Streptoalloteichus tenebrarius]MCP2258423.1 phosphocarrier protein [Streptoalloteichus tenebrarius]BFF03593.1 HPr family phosphocarrier protein [Streptoalloteichus tenebrarius]